jgi:hypothetical protein
MRFRAGAEGADFRAPARSPTQAQGPRFPPVETEDPDVGALANGVGTRPLARRRVAPHGLGSPPPGSSCVAARWASRRRRPAFCSARRATADRIRPRPPDRARLHRRPGRRPDPARRRRVMIALARHSLKDSCYRQPWEVRPSRRRTAMPLAPIIAMMPVPAVKSNALRLRRPSTSGGEIKCVAFASPLDFRPSAVARSPRDRRKSARSRLEHQRARARLFSPVGRPPPVASR